jgi:ankyrin repeat protein
MQIHCRAKHGDVEGVRRLLDRGVPVDLAEHSSGLTPLHRACASPEAGVDLVEMLLDSGANIDALGTCDETPLRLATRCRDAAKVRALLSRGCSRRATPMGYTALVDTVNHNVHLDLVRILIDAGVDPNAQSTYGESALACAYGYARFDLVRFLLEHGADPGRLSWDPLERAIAIESSAVVIGMIRDHLMVASIGKRTPMLLALERGELPIIEALASRGVDVEREQGPHARTALMYASIGDRVPVLAWCLDHGVDPNQPDDFGETPLMEAANRGATGCVRALLAANADLTATTGTGDYAITMASNFDTVKVLIEAGADINTIDGCGYGLLKSSAERGLITFATALLKAGANPDATSTGDTALHTATCYDELALMRELFAHGANVNAIDVDGWSPLFQAESVEAVRLLIEHGADPTIEDDTGTRARDWIAKRNEDAAFVLPTRSS